MSSPSSTGPRAVTVLISRRVRPEAAAEFEAAMAGMMAAAERFPGHLGGQLVRPSERGSGDEPMLYHVVFAFDDEEHLAAWERSAERAHWLAKVQPLTLAEQRDRVSGLEYWFQPASPKAPPRWRVAVVTWLGIFPTVLFLFLTVAPLLESWPLVPRVAVITVLVVLIMTWLVAPRLTRWLSGWLHAGR